MKSMNKSNKHEGSHYEIGSEQGSTIQIDGWIMEKEHEEEYLLLLKETPRKFSLFQQMKSDSSLLKLILSLISVIILLIYGVIFFSMQDNIEGIILISPSVFGLWYIKTFVYHFVLLKRHGQLYQVQVESFVPFHTNGTLSTTFQANVALEVKEKKLSVALIVSQKIIEYLLKKYNFVIILILIHEEYPEASIVYGYKGLLERKEEEYSTTG